MYACVGVIEEYHHDHVTMTLLFMGEDTSPKVPVTCTCSIN